MYERISERSRGRKVLVADARMKETDVPQSPANSGRSGSGPPEPSIPSSTAVFADLLRQNQSQLFGYIHSLVRDLHDADDLFQQVTLILWKKFDDFDPARSFLAWSCGIARLEVCNFLRVRGRSKLYFSDQHILLLIAAHNEMSHDESEARGRALEKCIGKLRDADRQLVLDCYADSSDINRVAEQMGRSSQSIHNSLRRIRRALFECVRRTLNQQPPVGAIE